jgi:hypothetical protein
MFHQDIDAVYPTIEEMASYAVRVVPASDRGEVLKFLDGVLSGNYTKGELKALWRRSEADVYFRDGEQVRLLLRLMRDKLPQD